MTGRPGPREVLAALRQVELFAPLDEAVLQELTSLVRVREFQRGELLFVEGGPGDALLVLIAGSVALFRTSVDGERAVLHVHESPEVLGEIELLDGAPRSASVEALTTATVLSLSRTEFLGLLHAQPGMLDPLLRQLGAMVRQLTEQAADRVFLDLAGRVAKVLLRLGGPGPSPSVAITQGRLAEMSGGTRQSVNQVLGGFGQRGLVHLEGRRIVLTDVPGLRRRAHLPPDAGLPLPTQPQRRGAPRN
jgi:CRP-like cAMP-binding protein